MSMAGGYALALEGDGKVGVRCSIGLLEAERLTGPAAPAVGQTVKVFGEVQSFNLPADAVPLMGCLVVTK